MAGDDDFLSLFSETLATVSGTQPAPAPVPAPVAAPARSAPAGKVVYVGFDDATRTVFQQNFSDKMPFVDTADLQQVKQLLTQGQIALLVFDGTSFIKPGIAVTKFIKEKALPVRVAHVFAPQRVTEEYEKYRQYHIHIQPDYRGFTDEIFMVVDTIKKDFGLA
jgi:hypothetical protein